MDKALKSVLEWWDAAGVDVPEISAVQVKSKTKPAPPSAPTDSNAAPNPSTRRQARPTANSETSKPILDTAPLAASAKTLSELKSTIEKFEAGPLSSRARQSVFARGNPDADIMIIGEAPGKDDDIAGKPFVGQEGKLLNRMMSAIGLSEEKLYMTTVINWRLPQNRNPKAEEIDICRPFIMRHIELAAPKFIVLLGNISLMALTGQTGIMKNRGQWQTISIGGKDIPALPIYAPTFLLKQPALKKEAWRDLRELRQKLLEQS